MFKCTRKNFNARLIKIVNLGISFSPFNQIIVLLSNFFLIKLQAKLSRAIFEYECEISFFDAKSTKYSPSKEWTTHNSAPAFDHENTIQTIHSFKIRCDINIP